MPPFVLFFHPDLFFLIDCENIGSRKAILFGKVIQAIFVLLISFPYFSYFVIFVIVIPEGALSRILEISLWGIPCHASLSTSRDTHLLWA